MTPKKWIDFKFDTWKSILMQSASYEALLMKIGRGLLVVIGIEGEKNGKKAGNRLQNRIFHHICADDPYGPISTKMVPGGSRRRRNQMCQLLY